MNEQDQKLDPRDYFFGAMLQIDLGRQFSWFSMIKPQWFTLPQHKSLYECLSYHVEKQIEMNLLTCVQWFKSNGKLQGNFGIVHISKLTENVTLPTHPAIELALNNIAYLYFLEVTQLFSIKIQQKTNAVNFDLDEVRLEVDAFQKRIDEDYIEELEQTNDEIIEEILKSHENAKVGQMPGISIGFNSLCHILLEPVDFMVIGARPSMGKTAFVLSAVYNMVFKENKTVVVFSLEMSKIQIMRRILAVATGIGDEDIKLGRCSDEDLIQIKAFKKHANWKNLIIYEGTHKPSDIIRKTTILSQKTHIDCIMVDYLQKISPERTTMKMIESVSNASNQMKNLSMNLKIPTIALAQLSRSVEQRGGDKRPVLSDLRESGEIEQDASIVAFLHRPEYYGIMEDDSGESTVGRGEFILAKNRGGKIENTKMSFIGHLMRWGDLNEKNTFSQMPVNTGFDNENKNFSEKSDDVPF